MHSVAFSQNNISLLSTTRPRVTNEPWYFKKQQIILDLISSCTEDNIADKLQEVIKNDSILKQTNGLFDNPEHTRSEIYALCALYMVANFGKFPNTYKQINLFIKCKLALAYWLKEDLAYFKEFCDPKVITKLSWSGQVYNVAKIREQALKQSDTFYDKSKVRITGINGDILKYIFSYLPVASRLDLDETCKYFNSLNTTIDKKIRIKERWTLDKRVKVDQRLESLFVFLMSSRCKVNSLDLEGVNLSKKMENQQKIRFELLWEVLQSSSSTITSLNISFCKLEKLAVDFDKLLNLTYVTHLGIDFCGNEYDIIRIKLICKMENLISLIIESPYSDIDLAVLEGHNIAQFLLDDSMILILQKLEELHINSMGVLTLDYIVPISKLRLTSLKIHNCGLTEVATKYITVMQNLTSLDLSRNSCIEFTSTMPNLTYLNISKNILINDTMQIISNMPKLKRLEISACSLTSEDIELISLIEDLTYLDISTNSLTDESIQFIRNMPKLKYLNISDNHLTELGIEQLKSMKFTWLDIRDNYRKPVPSLSSHTPFLRIFRDPDASDEEPWRKVLRERTRPTRGL